MRLTADFSGEAVRFEGERTVQIQGLPEGAQIKHATITLTPVAAPGRDRELEGAAVEAAGPDRVGVPARLALGDPAGPALVGRGHLALPEAVVDSLVALVDVLPVAPVAATLPRRVGDGDENEREDDGQAEGGGDEP